METTTLILLFILVWGIIGITFLCIGIGLHIRGKKKKKYLYHAGNCDRSGYTKRTGGS